MARLRSGTPPATPHASADAASGESGQSDAGQAPEGQRLDPKRFLLEVMNDRSVELQLRIEAAKALLPYFEDPRQR